MSRTPMKDVVVLIPGITGSVLQKDGKDIWAVSGGAAARALLGLGRLVSDLELTDDSPDADDLGDGITAPRIMPDVSLIPGLWKIDGYGKVAGTIKETFDVAEGANFFEFPYDWRRDNRASARALARSSHAWLSEWRERSGNQDAKLILVGHSMGGLVSRHFLELLDGWKDTRMLITFGTPYRGSLNALSFIARGMKRKLGPVTLVDLTALLQSFTSVYQLLPIYPCVESGGQMARVTEVEGIPGLDPARAAGALDFHTAIREAVDANRAESDYLDNGYQIQPVVGLFQPTLQSARLTGDELEILGAYQDEDLGGDGTVPRVSATPIELSNQDREVYIKERHGSLQNADHALSQLIGVLGRQSIDQSRFFAPAAGLSLDIDDAFLADEPVPVRVLPEVEWAQLTATVVSTETGSVAATSTLTPGDDGWHAAELGPLGSGTYRLTVRGESNIDPVTDVFAVFDTGADLEG